MLGNDISNKQSPFIMFDADSLLFKEKDKKTAWDRITDLVKSPETKYLERDLNPATTNGIMHVWNNHPYSIGLFTFDLYQENHLNTLEQKLADGLVPYTRVFNYADWEELRYFNFCIYIVTDNAELRSYLSRNEAISYEQFREVVR
jgi:hypothetical protein